MLLHIQGYADSSWRYLAMIANLSDNIWTPLGNKILARDQADFKTLKGGADISHSKFRSYFTLIYKLNFFCIIKCYT
jgi:hypothetical protein